MGLLYTMIKTPRYTCINTVDNLGSLIKKLLIFMLSFSDASREKCRKSADRAHLHTDQVRTRRDNPSKSSAYPIKRNTSSFCSLILCSCEGVTLFTVDDGAFSLTGTDSSRWISFVQYLVSYLQL